MAKSEESRDPELTALIDRAKKLRISINELCKECGETSVTVWRWQFVNTATWERRKEFMDKAKAFLDAEQKKYSKL